MTSTLAPETPAFVPGQLPTSPSVFANLLPDEVIEARQARRMRDRAAIGLVLLIVLLAGWYGLTIFQTSHANSKLAAASDEANRLQAQQQRFTPLLRAQQQATTISTQLRKLMAGDVQWSDVLAGLRAAAPAGVSLQSITGSLSTGTSCSCSSAASGGAAVLNTSGKPTIGTMTVSGNAPDKATVAAYVDKLAAMAGVTSAYPASVTNGATGYTFSVQLMLTTDALGGRFSTGTGGH